MISFELAIRISEIVLVVAFLQQAFEHFSVSHKPSWVFITRGVLCALVLAGVLVPWALLGLATAAFFLLLRFQGPYNGGSDRMGILILFSLVGVHFLPEQNWKEIAFGYLAIQLVLSYFISGWVKIVNRDWRQGQALRDVFLFSAYPVGENIRAWADRPRLLVLMSWSVMLFELLFPLSLVSEITFLIGLAVAAIFHLANACLFGLNRFFWVWLAAYPSIIWFQARFISGLV